MKHHPQCPWLKRRGQNCGYPCKFSDKSTDPDYIQQVIYGLKLKIQFWESKLR